jgi:hypothetical protein
LRFACHANLLSAVKDLSALAQSIAVMKAIDAGRCRGAVPV